MRIMYVRALLALVTALLLFTLAKSFIFDPDSYWLKRVRRSQKQRLIC
jgi:hypothetical protein